MKLLWFFNIFLILSVQLHAAKGKSCRSADHCRESECCMTKSSMIGGCREMACEGCPCEPNNAKSHLGDMYLWSCPCSQGLECVAEKIIENSLDKTVEYINSTCVANASSKHSAQKLQTLPRFTKMLLRITD